MDVMEFSQSGFLPGGKYQFCVLKLCNAAFTFAAPVPLNASYWLIGFKCWLFPGITLSSPSFVLQSMFTVTVTNHFSGPGRAIDPVCVCVSVSRQ